VVFKLKRNLIVFIAIISFIYILNNAFANCGFINEVKVKIINELILSGSINDFELISDLITSDLEVLRVELENLPSQAIELNRLWIKKLADENIIKAAYINIKNKIEIIGCDFKPLFLNKSSFYIDKYANLHYLRVNKNLYIDIILNIPPINNLLMDQNMCISMVLYDNKNGNIITIYQKNDNFKFRKSIIVDHLGSKNPVLAKNVAFMSKDLELNSSKVFLVSSYSFLNVKNIVWLLGLLLLAILTILLLVWVLKYACSIKKYKINEMVKQMNEKKSEKDIISEIDKEISDIIEKPEKKIPFKSEGEETLKEFEKDGVYIKKIK